MSGSNAPQQLIFDLPVAAATVLFAFASYATLFLAKDLNAMPILSSARAHTYRDTCAETVQCGRRHRANVA